MHFLCYSPLVLDMDRSHSSMMFLSKYMLHPTHKVVFLADYSKLEAEKVYDKFLVEAKNRYRDFKFAMGDLQWNQETIQYFMLEDDMFPVLIIHWNNPDPNIQDTVYRNVHIDHVEDLGLILDASLEQYNNNTKVLQGYRESEAADIAALIANILCIALYAASTADTLEELDVNQLLVTLFGSDAVDDLIVKKQARA